MAQPLSGVAAPGGERSAGHEGDTVADRVHVALAQAGHGEFARSGPALGAQGEDKAVQRPAREGTGE